MSSSLGVWRPFSSLLTLDGGHDNDSASCRPLNPAAWRSSRSRLPRAALASSTLDAPEVLFGGKVVPSHRVMPGDITPVVVLHDLGGVLDDLPAEEGVVVIEVHSYQPARVEQPVVVPGQRCGVRHAPSDVPDVLTRAVGELRTPHAEAAVVGERHRDYPHASEAAALDRGLAQHVKPALHPGQVVRLAGEELPQRLVLIAGVVAVTGLQPVGRVLEAMEQLPDLW